MVARILRSRNLRRLLLAFLGFNAAEYATWIAILLYAYVASGPESVGVVALVLLVPASIVAPLAASLGDRYPRHRVLLLGYLAYAIGTAATTLAMVVGAPPPVVYVVAALGGAPLVIIRPTQSALIPALSETVEEATSADAAAQIVEGLGILVGPLISAGILLVAPPSAIYAIGTLAALAGAILVRPLQPLRITPLPSAATDAQAPDAQPLGPHRPWAIVAGLRAVIGDPDARLVVGLMSARMVVIGAADVLFVLMALELLGTGDAGAAILTAAFGTGAIIGGALSLALAGRARLAAVAAAGASAWGLCLGITGGLASPVLAIPLLIGGGAGLAIVDVAARIILQRSIRDEVLASVFGIQEGLAMAGLAVGCILIPALVRVVGLGGAIGVMAVFLPLLVAVTWSRLRSLDERTVVPARELSLLRKVALFDLLPGPTLETIARHSTWRSFPAGAEVIREGDPGLLYFVLESGAVRVERDGRKLRDLGSPGDGFGEIALLRDIPRTATVTTSEPSTMLVIGRPTFLAAITRHPMAAARADRTMQEAVM